MRQSQRTKNQKNQKLIKIFSIKPVKTAKIKKGRSKLFLTMNETLTLKAAPSNLFRRIDRARDSKKASALSQRDSKTALKSSVLSTKSSRPIRYTTQGAPKWKREALLQQEWDSRPLACRLTTAHYQGTQRRLVPLLAVEPTRRLEAFLAKTQHVGCATRASYWVALASAAKLLDKPTAQAQQQVTRWLQGQARTHPGRVPVPVTINHIAQILAYLKATPPSGWKPEAVVSVIAFVVAQRAGDVSQIRKEAVEFLRYATAITIFEGKVTAKIGPFTVFVAPTTSASSILRTWLGVTPFKQYIFMKDNRIQTRTRFVESVKKFLRQFDPALEARSLRRGGLQQHAMNGCSVETLLAFSQHSGEPMLRKYLDFGKWMACRAVPQAAATAALDNQINALMNPSKATTSETIGSH